MKGIIDNPERILVNSQKFLDMDNRGLELSDWKKNFAGLKAQHDAIIAGYEEINTSAGGER